MPTIKATPEEIERLANIPGAVVGRVMQASLLKEAIASCRLDGETQCLKPIAAKAKIIDRRAEQMNRLERQYSEYLEEQRVIGAIALWVYSPMKLRLADLTYYSPDFMVIAQNGEVEFHETKGFMRDDANVKIKVAAEQFPWFTFVLVTRKKKEWRFETK